VAEAANADGGPNALPDAARAPAELEIDGPLPSTYEFPAKHVQSWAATARDLSSTLGP